MNIVVNVLLLLLLLLVLFLLILFVTFQIDSKLAEELKKGLLEENRHQSWDVIQDKV